MKTPRVCIRKPLAAGTLAALAFVLLALLARPAFASGSGVEIDELPAQLIFGVHDESVSEKPIALEGATEESGLSGTRAPRMIAGFSAFIVLTGSMQDEIPKDSLIVTYHVDPDTLQVGDDITYMISENDSITHRIVGIEENFQGSGERAFKTQGIMNSLPDRNLAPAANVVGKVIFHSYHLGVVAKLIRDNIVLIALWGGIAFALVCVLKRIYRSPESMGDVPVAEGEGSESKRA